MADPESPYDRSFFGHPRGLSTLFFTEMWERFSYYGIRALLLLYMTADVSSGGLGMSAAIGGPIYGLFTSMAYMMALPGGWIADRLIGQRRAVLYGGLLIAAGNFSIAIPATSLTAFYLGLALIVCGTGLLKGNVSVIVGKLYKEHDNRRDAGFSIFYMGINLGAFAAPLFCGKLGQQINWHLGFAAAGVGMLLGLTQYVLSGTYLGEAGKHPVPAESPDAADRLRRNSLLVGGGLILLVALFAGLSYSGALPITAVQVADAGGVFLLLLVVVFFGWLYFVAEWTPAERKRLYLIGVLFVASALFWSVFEQAGSTLNLFADRNTHNVLFGWEYPSSWFQSLNSLFIFALAPVFAWLWVKLANAGKEPSYGAKFAIGLIFVGLGFAVLIAPAGTTTATGARVSLLWLTTTYLIHTIGELSLSPVGLSAMTKLAPARIAGLMMGVWFLATSVGNYMGGRVAGLYESWPLPNLFLAVAVFAVVAGLILFAFVKPMKRLLPD